MALVCASASLWVFCKFELPRAQYEERLLGIHTYNGEYVRGLVCNIVNFLISFGALGITGDDVLRHTLELFSGERDDGLAPYMSQSQQNTRIIITCSSLKFF